MYLLRIYNNSKYDPDSFYSFDDKEELLKMIIYQGLLIEEFEIFKLENKEEICKNYYNKYLNNLLKCKELKIKWDKIYNENENYPLKELDEITDELIKLFEERININDNSIRL